MRLSLPIAAIVVWLVFGSVSAAARIDEGASSCGAKDYSYAGVQAKNTSRGVSATLATTTRPSVVDGHVGAWIGLGGTRTGPGGKPEWIQAGLAAFPSDLNQMYYEVAAPDSPLRYIRLDRNVAPGARHRFAVLEMVHKLSWWRVWIDGKPVSPPIHLPGSDNTWYPQAVAETWNGGTGACNSYSYRFSDVLLEEARGGAWSWQPLRRSFVFHDVGYRVMPISGNPRSFLAASLAS